MAREFFLELAASRLRMPVGADLVLHEQSDPEAILLDGVRLGQVLEQAARRFNTPLAFHLMDLRLEKADLLEAFGVPAGEVDQFHFTEAPSEADVARIESQPDRRFSPRHEANLEAIRHIARKTDLFPCGMALGPFSMMTKLLSDPITPVAMAGSGLTSDEDPGVKMVERCLRLAEFTIARSFRAQIAAGVKGIVVCEPAASITYLSPRQLRAGADTLERYVLQPNLRLKKILDDAGVDLVFHDCGELIPEMVEAYAQRIHPAMLSLGSSRVLWEDAGLVPKDVVLFGNLPTKTFYSDSAMPVEEVERRTLELVAKMRQAGHPYILGSECDVLHVPDAAATIRRKVERMLTVTE